MKCQPGSWWLVPPYVALRFFKIGKLKDCDIETKWLIHSASKGMCLFFLRLQEPWLHLSSGCPIPTWHLRLPKPSRPKKTVERSGGLTFPESKMYTHLGLIPSHPTGLTSFSDAAAWTPVRMNKTSFYLCVVLGTIQKAILPFKCLF